MCEPNRVWFGSESDLLPDLDECENFIEIILFSLPGARTPTERTPALVRESPMLRVVRLAFEFQRLLDEGVVNTRAEIADRHGISRARVTQLLNLLKLPESVLGVLLESCREDRVHCTERQLRPILRLPEADQLAALQRLQECDHGAG